MDKYVYVRRTFNIEEWKTHWEKDEGKICLFLWLVDIYGVFP